MSELSNIIAALAIFCVLAIAIPYYLTKQEEGATKEKITALADSTIEMTPKEFFDRVNSHFTGKGNGDVYADYKYGDQFTIRIISLEKSGMESLNELERKIIATYDAFSKGYNKTRGNRN